MKALKLLVLGLLMVLVAVPMASGQTWDSSFNVVNLGTNVAHVSVTFYAEDGTPYAPGTLHTSTGDVPNPFPLNPGASVEILPFLSSDTDLPDGRYSVVLSAEEPIAAIANLTTWIAQEGAPYFNGSYSGASEGLNAMYMPAIVNDYYDWNSDLHMQNLTNADANITVEFYTEGSNVACATQGPHDTPAYASWHLDVSALDLSACDVNADGYNGSARVSSDGAVAAMDNQTATGGVYGPVGRTQSYNGFTNGATTIYVPALYYKYYCWDSSLNIQNIGTDPTTVEVTYSDGTNASCELDPGASCLLYQPTEGIHTENTYFSAVLVATQPIVAVANASTAAADDWEMGVYCGNIKNQAQTVNGFLGGAPTFGLPLIMKNYYGWYTSYTVQNVDTADVNVTVTYAGVSGCADLALGTLSPGESREIYQGADPLCSTIPDGYRNAVTVEATGNIVVQVNQTNFENRDNPNTTGDWSQSYNGLPVQ